MLHNAMDMAQTSQQKQLILEELGTVKPIYPFFLPVITWTAAVQHEAAYAVMKIGLSDNDWTGEPVRRLLDRAIPLLNGPDASYEKQAIQKHLAELPSGEGFVSIFNGKDLTGWKGLVANPLKERKWMRQHWKKSRKKQMPHAYRLVGYQRRSVVQRQR